MYRVIAYSIMKKIFVLLTLLGVLAATIIIFVSCKKEEKVRSLTEELAILNKDIESQIERAELSKGKFGKWLAVVGADVIAGWEGGKIGATIGGIVTGGNPIGIVVGGAIGGAVCGGGASGLAEQAFSKSIRDPYPNGYISTLTSRYSDFNLTGEWHNMYLDLLFKTNFNPDVNTIYNQIFSNSIDKETFDKLMEKVGPNSKTYNDILSIINDYVRSDYDINVLLDQFKRNFGMSEETEEIWYSFFNMYSSVTEIDDAYYVVERYIDFVNETSARFLKSDEIKSFNCALSVALHSTNYWSILNE